jgi:tetratricopeptide (TPR) repeat protein
MAQSLRCLPFVFLLALCTAAARADDWQNCKQQQDTNLSLTACSNILQRGEESRDNQAVAYSSRGDAYRAKGLFDMAFADYTRAIELNPNYEQAYYGRSYIYMKKGEFDAAIADCTRAISANPKYENAYICRGYTYFRKGDAGQAVADYTRAISVNPKFLPAYIARAFALEASGDYQKALADKAIAVELSPNNAGLVFQLGLGQFLTGDFRSASATLKRSLDMKNDIHAMLYRYLARARAGEATGAEELEVNAGRLKTNEWPYAVIDLYLGKRSPALTLEAAGKPGDECEARFHIGEWYILQNQPAEAEAALKMAAETCRNALSQYPKILYEYHGAQAELKRMKP